MPLSRSRKRPGSSRSRKRRKLGEMQLIIAINAAGQPTVSGPIDNPIVAFGMLELAKVIIVKHLEAKEKRVQIPEFALPQAPAL